MLPSTITDPFVQLLLQRGAQQPRGGNAWSLDAKNFRIPQQIRMPRKAVSRQESCPGILDINTGRSPMCNDEPINASVARTGPAAADINTP